MYCYRKFHKEIGKCTIHTDSYGRSLNTLLEMFHEAKKDFPGLEEKDIEVINIVGPTNGRLIGIRFDVEGKKVPRSYEGLSA